MNLIEMLTVEECIPQPYDDDATKDLCKWPPVIILDLQYFLMGQACCLLLTFFYLLQSPLQCRPLPSSRTNTFCEIPTAAKMMQMSQWNLLRIRITIAFLFGLLASTTVLATTLSYVEACKQKGFDPWHLACSTCSLLPASAMETCRSCCQSYKTLERQAKRYEAAILVDSGFSSSVEEVLREDQEIISSRKKGLMIKKSVNGGGGGGLFQMYAEPSLILWYSTPPSASMESSSLQQLSDDAEEVTTLDGFSRDDIREMLLALLPDKP